MNRLLRQKFKNVRPVPESDLSLSKPLTRTYATFYSHTLLVGEGSMFSVVRRCFDPFKQRQKKQEVWKCLRRLMDNNAARALSITNTRNFTRTSICRSVLLQPYTEDGEVACEAIFAVTRDLCDDGISIITRQPLDCPSILCAFWHEVPVFISGDVRVCQGLGGGYWIVGVQFIEVVPIANSPELRALAFRLCPEAA